MPDNLNMETLCNNVIHIPEQCIPNTKKRIKGYDLARSVALLGMIIINFKCSLSQFPSDIPWLYNLIEKCEGRAAALFVMLAGTGISLLTRKALQNSINGEEAKPLDSNREELIHFFRRLLLKRGVFLFLSGAALSALWPWDILHFYGIYLTIAAFIFHRSDRFLAGSVIISILIFAAYLIIEPDESWMEMLVEGYDTPWYMEIFTAFTLFHGMYPVFPWITFLLAGMYIGRRYVSGKGFSEWLFIVGISLTIVSEFIFKDLEAVMTPPSILFLFSAGGCAMSIIAVCLYIMNRVESVSTKVKPSFVRQSWIRQPWVRQSWVKPFTDAGKMILTIYVAHILLGINIMLLSGLDELSIVIHITGAVLFYLLSLAFASLWFKYYTNGPLEWVMRKFSGITANKELYGVQLQHSP
ncbi:conserved membrane hypothetical protein [Desulfamplus magnetovallimortis]|uniref:DUF418 domain-containing protein n=1 Tax=Desulfamplus magnetovallimortis TaxID=1246637 RepID=A0A1W1HHY4_9BACT|nr:DUF418 domain-containing protein [Desulfamplus magnetovallimortis]SLM32056.1 conserved membrane hypothetical protein [Desulfamplus magnetovallimortis]